MASPKTAPAAQQGRNKKRNTKYIQQSSKRRKDSELRAGLQGFVITCDGGRERQSIREAIQLLERFYDTLGEGKTCSSADKPGVDKPGVVDEANPKQIQSDADPNSGEANTDSVEANAEGDGNIEKGNSSRKKLLAPAKVTDIESLLNDEISELRDKKQARFTSLDTGCAAVVFIRMLQEDTGSEIITRGPNELAVAIIEDCLQFRKPLSRFCLRFIPVKVTCYASADEVRKMAEPLLSQCFPVVDKEKALKFAVVYEARANTSLDRMEIISTLAKLIPEPHSVDLTNPDKTIVVQVIKTTCAIGVVDNYKEYSKYNIRQLTTSKEDNKESPHNGNPTSPKPENPASSEQEIPVQDNSVSQEEEN